MHSTFDTSRAVSLPVSAPPPHTPQVDCHFGKKKKLASIRTACSHVANLIKGVCVGHCVAWLWVGL